MIKLRFLHRFMVKSFNTIKNVRKYRELQITLIFLRIKMIIRFKFMLKKYRGVKNKIKNSLRSAFTFHSVSNNTNLHLKANKLIYNSLITTNICTGFFYCLRNYMRKIKYV